MADEAIHSFLDGHEQSATADIPVRPPLSCCCGNAACAYLKHNQGALDGLERDVCTAARLGKCEHNTATSAIVDFGACTRHGNATQVAVVLNMDRQSSYALSLSKMKSPREAQSDGSMSSLTFSLQALLTRHESYIADSERERKAMTAHVEELETERQALERKNATAIEENRDLLDQLENLNNAVADSDTQVLELQATLRNTQQELYRLSCLAARTEKLEQQLAEFERDQITWQSTLQDKELAEKDAVRRWQQAERTLADLQDQLERIEQEAKEEKDRNVEVLARMERRHAVERELDMAAGRLKGAAALKTAGTETSGQTVVSHFVKDILQDNANLQMGIIELRDMLQGSNEEVENLRKRLSIHQPLEEEREGEVVRATMLPPLRPHLKDEMRAATASELHVHHHYHAPAAAPKPVIKRSRSRKKRYGALGSGQFTPPSGLSTPRYSFSQATPSTTAAILSHTAASLPESVGGKSWSMQSHQMFLDPRDSGPSSPISTHRTSSVFDRVFSDAGQDSSRPTTPDTEDPGSPYIEAVQSKRSSRSSHHGQHRSTSSHKTRPSLDSILDVSYENIRHLDHQQNPEAVIPEEDEEGWANSSSPSRDISPNNHSPFSEELEQQLRRSSRPQLRRVASHESILSFSGMDIHTLKSRPSQLLTPYGSYMPQAVLSNATAHAAPAEMSRASNSSASILHGITPPQRHTSAGQLSNSKQGIGSKMGGWVFGRWGASPSPAAPTTADTPEITPKANRAASITSSSTGKSTQDAHGTPKPPKHRPSGINQSGPILGFPQETKRPVQPPVMKQLDQEALNSVLGEGS